MKNIILKFLFLLTTIILLVSSIYLNINTTKEAKERIITELNNTPIVLEQPITNIVEEPIIEETSKEEVEEEVITNSYTNKELIIIIITSVVAIICLLNLIVTKFGFNSLNQSLSSSKALIYYTIFLVLLTTISTLTIVIASDKKILNGSDTKNRANKSIAIIEVTNPEKANSLIENSTNDDTSIIQISNQAEYTATNLELLKSSGTTTDKESSMYYGLNSAVIVKDGSNATISDSTIKTQADYSSAIFLTGPNVQASLNNITLTTTNEYSNGLAVSDYGKLEASLLVIDTKGDNSPSIKTLTSNSEISISDSSLKTEGLSSPLIHSSGKINLTNIEGESLNSNISILKGNNSISIADSNLTTHNIKDSTIKSGIYIYNDQSKSASGDFSNSSFNIINSSLTISPSATDYEDISMFYVTNIKTIINLTNTKLNYSNKNLIKISGNETYADIGNNGGEVTFTATDQSLEGNIIIDELSKIRFNLNNSTYQGQINGDNLSQSVDITFDKTSKWILTGDSYINTLTIQNGKISRLSTSIKSNGYNIYYNANLNEWLNGKTIKLSGGGKLIPIYYNS